MMPEFTVKQYAKKEQVTIRTVRTWLSKGALKYRHTPGGHVRIIEPPSRVVVFSVKNGEKGGSSSR